MICKDRMLCVRNTLRQFLIYLETAMSCLGLREMVEVKLIKIHPAHESSSYPSNQDKSQQCALKAVVPFIQNM